MYTDLTREELKEAFHYDPDSGVFTRRKATNVSPVGSIAGRKDSHGGIQFSFKSKLRLAHRLAWLYVYGSWPNGFIDHIDGNPGNNRIQNLRDVDQCSNMQNLRGATKTNATGLLGVSPTKTGYVAAIQVNRIRYYLGVYQTPEAAHGIYLFWKRLVHPGCTI